MFFIWLYLIFFFFFSSRRRHTRCALVTGVQTCALPISLDLPDSIAGTSSMMPQKKNMVVLEDLKCRSAQFLGAAVTALAGVKGTTFTNTVDGNRGAFRWCWDAFAETIDSLIVTEVVVAKAKPNEERMRTLVEEKIGRAHV